MFAKLLGSPCIQGMINIAVYATLGLQLNNGKSIAGLLFVDDFVGISDSSENLRKLIDVVHKFCNRWRLKANVSKCAVVVFSKSKVPGS